MTFAFIFPGQGSQIIGMLSTIAEEYPIIKETFLEASQILGYNLWKLVQQGTDAELNTTYKTQPILLTASISLWRLWKQQNGQDPLIMAGHSLGEYSALVCAGVMNFIDTVVLVEKRGKFMQEAVPQGLGTMVAIIGLNHSCVEDICKKFSEDQIVSPVSFNSTDQVIISGHKAAVERASIACKNAGAKRTVVLPISVPSHCVLMKPAAHKLARALGKINFNTPSIPVINNVDVSCETKPEKIRDALVRQIYNPVQWVKIIEYISKQGIKQLYEIGPGNVLTRLTKRIVNTISASAINNPNAILKALSQNKRRIS